MAFTPNSLPATVREAYNTMGVVGWVGVVQTAIQAGIRDVDRLASIVFYLHHPERNGKQIASYESSMIKEWKAFRTLIVAMVPHATIPAPETTEPVGGTVEWTVDPVEAWKIQKAWGKELADWAMIAPVGTEAAEFSPPSSMRDHYKTVFAWKSSNPNLTCIANPKQRLQILAMLRDDKAYWDWRTGGSHVGTLSLSTAAATAIRDYRDYIVNRKMCPRAAYLRLLDVNKDVIFQMFLGLFQLLGPKGVPTAHAVGSEAIANTIGELIKAVTAKE